jgi:tryptophanyl-tRNA synthetase
MNTIFSGIQPTGSLHLGNYLGAIKNWKEIITKSSNSRFFFSIVDLHAITVHQKPTALQESILSTFATYLACGIEGENITVFQQSMVSQHTELAWILACNLQIGYLDRMTQYKDKTTEHKERACLGLYSYPVLMAADILLYNTNLVPVGEDQIQHIELTRDIANKFNIKYNKDILTMPQFVLTKSKRVMSLKDGTKKMSKSDESDSSRINLLDDANTITHKIKKAKTGTEEIQNLSSIFESITDHLPPSIENNMSSFKQNLTEAIITELDPIQKKYKELMNNKHELTMLLHKGANSARNIAEQNLEGIYKAIGLR